MALTPTKLALSKDDVFIILGLAFFLPCMQVAPYSYAFIQPLLNAGNSLAASFFHTVYPFVLIILFVLSVLRRRSLTKWFQSNRLLLLVFGVCGAFGSALIVLARDKPDSSLVLVLLGLFLLALYTVTFLLAWGLRAVQGSAHIVIMRLIAAFIIYEIGSIVFYTFDIDKGLLFVFCPLVSVTFSCLVTRSNGQHPKQSIATVFKTLDYRIVIPCFALVFFNNVIVKMLSVQSVATSVEQRAVTSAIALVLLVGVAVFLCRKKVSYNSLLIVFSALLVAYMAALLFILLFGQTAALTVTRTWVATGLSLKDFLLLYLAYAVVQYRLSPIVSFSFYGMLMMALTSTISLIQNVEDIFPPALLQTEALVPMGETALFIIAAVTIVLMIRHFAKSSKTHTEQRGASFEAMCREAFSTRGLTARESEVATLSCKGYSARMTAEKLYLSEHTVNSHLARIYRKLGIRSKQELVAFVEALREETPFL